MALVSERYDAPGELRVPALVLGVSLALAPITAAFRDIRSVVRVENMLAVAPIYWLLLDLIQGRFGIQIARREDVITGFLAIGVFSFGTWLAAQQRPWPLPRAFLHAGNVNFGRNTALIASIVCFVLGTFYYAYMAAFNFEILIQGLLAGNTAAPWSRVSATGDWRSFLEHLAYFGMVLPSLTVVSGIVSGWISFQTVISAGMSLVSIVLHAQVGNRRYVGVMIGAAIVAWVIGAGGSARSKVVGIVFGASFVLVLMEIILQFRGVGLGAITNADRRDALLSVSTVRVDDNFLRLAQQIYYVPEHHGYTWFEYPVFALIRPIPRVLWPNKPTAPSYRLQDYIQIGASLSSSVVGELYVSGGLISVLVGGWIYGCLGRVATRLLASPHTMSKVLLYGAWLMAVFAGCRSMQNLILMSYVVLAILAILWVVGRDTHSHIRQGTSKCGSCT